MPETDELLKNFSYDSANVNYRFLTNRALQHFKPGAKLLDFGCGKGDLVLAALSQGFDAYGVEYFGPGSGTNIKDTLEKRNLLGNRVHGYDGTRLPLDDNSFDVVVSNQVFEHVPDLPVAVDEICRVLKKDGMLITSFPYQDSIREGHCGVPIAHWLPNSRRRVAWLLFFRLLGFGRLKPNRGYLKWARFFNDWLTENTFYRHGAELEEMFQDRFSTVDYIEPSYSAFRLEDTGKTSVAKAIVRPPLIGATRFMTRQFGGLVLEARAPLRQSE